MDNSSVTSTPTSDDLRPVLFLFTPESDFVRPYFERFMPDFRLSDSPVGAEAAVMISSTDIYDVAAGENFNELTPVDPASPFATAEREFTDACAANGLKPTILRCAPIVATGMNGWPRRLADRIYRGTYLGLSGNEARRSVVHAVSLPEAAGLVLRSGEIYNVTDTVDPTVNALADALAWRIAQKRVFTLPAKWFRFIFGKKKLGLTRSSLTFSCAKLLSAGDFRPVSVVDYLKTHVYDESSL